MIRGRFLIVGIILLFISVFTQLGNAQYSGLRFSGQGTPLDQRTGLSLTPETPFSFKKSIELRFDLNFEPNDEGYFGYIFRALINDQNYDLIFTMDPNQENNLNFIIGNEISSISFNVPEDRITAEWIPLGLTLDIPGNIIRLEVDGQSHEQAFDFEDTNYEMLLFFGAHRHTRFVSTDLPTMNIREIDLTLDQKKKYRWPLNETEGTIAHESMHTSHGKVDNPVWISGLYGHWKLDREFEFPGRLSFTYDDIENRLYFLLRDSIVSYELTDKTVTAISGLSGCEPGINAHILFDPYTKQLLCYSVDRRKLISLSDYANRRIPEFSDQTLTTHWHHNRFIDPADGRFYVFGGYGQHQYLNQVLVFNEEISDWDTVDYKGSYYPRYLAGLGYNPLSRTVYILGGFGSTSGNQAISPGYYHELLAYSIETEKFETVAEFDDSDEMFCFANSMHYDTISNTLYALKFSKLEANPSVQAVAISLHNPELKEVGNTFQFQFMDIRSDINLFYNQAENKLITVSSFFNDENTQVSVHEINFPPIHYVRIETPQEPDTSRNYGLITGISAALLAILLFIFLRRNKLRREIAAKGGGSDSSQKEAAESIAAPQKQAERGSIRIFGGFKVVSMEGKDITSSFTPLLKELFLYILLPSLRYDKGVSSSSMNEVFWFDKSEQSARNNRATNITKLRSLLVLVGDCKISKDTGYWKFNFNPSDIYIDFYEYLQLINTGQVKSREGISKLLQITRFGPALQNIQTDWLDEFKSGISNEIVDNILEYIRKHKKNTEEDFIIDLANCIFYFDSVNEEAMLIKCKILATLGKHSLAKQAYVRFIKEYKLLYGEDYAHGFNDILEEQS